MGPLLPVVGLLIAAAITPGPNNFIVMEAGARRGLAAAGAAVLGVVLGSLVLLVLIWSGIGAAIRAFPATGIVLSLCGGAYLGWLGASLLARSHDDAPGAAPPAQRLPSSALGVAAFQLVNPKAWVLVTTAAAAMSGNGSMLTLAALMAAVTSLCLLLWALAGTILRRLLARRPARLWFDRAMGGLLTVSALGIMSDALV